MTSASGAAATTNCMELMRALGALAELPGTEHVRLAELLGLGGPVERADYTALFVLELPPYASVYLGVEGLLGGAVRDRVAGFWGALGQMPPSEPDHITALLGLYAAIETREESQDDTGASVLRHARKALFWEHIVCWLPPYLSRVAELAAPAYRSWASVLLEALAAEARTLEPPSVEPLHFREAGPRLPEEYETVEDLTAALLAPARSGLILARADLARMARELGAGARIGDRRFVLGGLVRQEGDRALSWLADEAARQASLHTVWPVELHPVRGFWTSRAERSVSALAQLRGGSSSVP